MKRLEAKRGWRAERGRESRRKPPAIDQAGTWSKAACPFRTEPRVEGRGR
jgi:hypothetical protein